MKSLLATELKNFSLPENLGIEAILKAALANGGDLAELFFEDTASTRVVYEGGRVDRVWTGAIAAPGFA